MKIDTLEEIIKFYHDNNQLLIDQYNIENQIMKTMRIYRLVDYLAEQFMILVDSLGMTYNKRQYVTKEHTAVTVNASHNQIQKLDQKWDELKQYFESNYITDKYHLHAHLGEQKHKIAD